MSRKSKGTAGSIKLKDNKGPPPSHPSEVYKEHRNWLIRSLERNDVEIAALMELNHSLHEARGKILQSCGELVLLDLGCGRLTLVNDELHEETGGTDGNKVASSPLHRLTPAQKEICVDFLLRMKLRRNLSNRLVRRLNRVAHAMDGNDVTPPAPPRYGDLRLNIDADAVEERIAEWRQKESAKQRIRAALAEGFTGPKPELAKSSSLEEKPSDVVAPRKDGESEKAALPSAEEECHDRDAETGNEPATPPVVSNAMITDVAPQPMNEEAIDVSKDSHMDTDSSTLRAPGSETTEKVGSAMTVCHMDDGNNTSDGALCKAENADRQGIKEASLVASPSLEEDYAILKEYNSAYEKVWDNSTNCFKYVLSEQDAHPEYTKIKHGGGIGATTRIMSVQEREAEYKRWEANILARIPDQPTFEELGLKNRVFHLEARRKRFLDEAAADQDDGEAWSPEKKTKVDVKHEKRVAAIPKHRPSGKELRKRTEDDGDDAMDTSVDSDDELNNEGKNDDDEDNIGGGDQGVKKKSDTSRVEDDEDEKTNSDDDDDEGKDEDEGEVVKKDAENVVEAQIRPMRPISLVAVPSFYEQDLARIRMIHKDLMNTSITNHARQRLTEVTKEYNKVYKSSNELFDTCQRLQHNLTLAIAKGRQELTKATNDYAAAFNLAKDSWLKEKMEHDMSRTNALMPSKWGRPAFGTDSIQDYIRNSGNNVLQVAVGQTVADIVDGSIMVANGQASMKSKFRDFVPPPNDPNAMSHLGENMTQRQLRVETEYRNQYNAMSAKFQESEAERGRAWRKMMKTRAELDVPHDQSLAESFPRGKVDLTNYHLIPLPPLRSSSKQTIPRELQPQAAAVASYTPPNTLGSTSKYSAAKIKARKAADGTVAPVSEPKKTKDGLYMRPAGRTRKGMQWDAVNGVWVPEGSQ